jgi:hypothetical protein
MSDFGLKSLIFSLKARDFASKSLDSGLKSLDFGPNPRDFTPKSRAFLPKSTHFRLFLRLADTYQRQNEADREQCARPVKRRQAIHW